MKRETCCPDTCDMFEFMSVYVGLNTLHPGGVKATRDVLEKLNLDNRKTVLDIACGKGISSVLIAKKYGCRVVGIDILEDSIDYARYYAKRQGVEKLVSFQIGDAQLLPFSDNEFDVTIAQAMLILVENKEKVIKEASRVLKIDGKSAWLELSWKQTPTKEFLDDAIKAICAICINNVMTFSDWEMLVGKNGFQKVELNQYSMEFRGLIGMVKDEGIINGLRVIYKYISNSKIRGRMQRLDNFFKSYPEKMGYGIFIGTKNDK
jgi:ubiquinone/menaquinone biosynthesis C-methylase UbiE